MSENTVQSVDRLLDIIEKLSANPRGVGLVTLSENVGLHRSTTYRLLTSLINRGYVSKDRATKKYQLTLKFFEIGSTIVGATNILSVANPYLTKLSDISGEVIHLALRDGSDIIFVYKEDTTENFVRMGSRIGLRSPMYCTGVGKAMLAELPNQEIKQIWESTDIVSYTKNTIVTYDAMMEEVVAIRNRGYAIDNEEWEPGVRCIAAAIKDYEGNPFAAICISASAYRMTDERIHVLESALLTTAADISKIYGQS